MRAAKTNSRPAFLAVAALTVSLAVVACGKNTTPPDLGTPPAEAPSGTPITMIAPDLPLLPAAIVNASRPIEMTKAAYEFAARHPEVMNFVPCFCGCERAGHQGNHDCFVSARNDAGEVTAWEPHGLGCQVCIDVGFQAMTLHARGASVAEIRTAIDEQYAGASFHTPTPAPPSGGGPQHP